MHLITTGENQMKRSIKATLTGLALLLTAGSAWAYPVEVGQSVKMVADDTLSGHYQAYYGTGYTSYFGTFCVEMDEHFTSGTVYRVDSISDTAWLGGANTNTGDPLSFATKWLYSHYLQGNLYSSLSINPGANDSYLQNAIWALEEEQAAPTSGFAKTLYDAALSASENESLAYDVKVMNLEDFCNNTKQSQLIGELQPVPEPSTLLLLGGGIAGLALARRRATKK
jgi:hypothetical protein